MSLVRWRPVWGLRRQPRRHGLLLRDDLDELFEETFGRWWPRGEGAVKEDRSWVPALDLYERDGDLVARVELPGLEKEDVHVTLENQVLTIEGERKVEEEVQEDDYYCCEQRYGKFYRALSLPPGIDEHQVTASFKNGVLEVKLPRSEKAKPETKKIAIEG